MESTQNSTAPEEKHQVKIGPRTLLFDLNKDLHNFDVYFEVESENSEEEFHVRVLTQKQLDQSSSKDILQDEDSFKKTKGYINGNVKSQENVSENHFLALKAPKDMTLFIKTRILPISPAVVITKPSVVSSEDNSEPVACENDETAVEDIINFTTNTDNMGSTYLGLTLGQRIMMFFRSTSFQYWFFYGLLTLVVVGTLYYIFVYRKNKKSSSSKKSDMSTSKEKEEADYGDDANKKIESEEAEEGEEDSVKDSDIEGDDEDGKSEVSSVSSSTRSTSSKGSGNDKTFQQKLQKYLQKKSVK